MLDCNVYFWKEDYEDASGILDSPPFSIFQHHQNAYKIHIAEASKFFVLIEKIENFVSQHYAYFEFIKAELEDTTLEFHIRYSSQSENVSFSIDLADRLSSIGAHIVLIKSQ